MSHISTNPNRFAIIPIGALAGGRYLEDFITGINQFHNMRSGIAVCALKHPCLFLPVYFRQFLCWRSFGHTAPVNLSIGAGRNSLLMVR
jgi:hypothetical protein